MLLLNIDIGQLVNIYFWKYNFSNRKDIGETTIPMPSNSKAEN